MARNIFILFPDANEDKCKADLLHDTMEDCGIDEAFLLERGFAEECIHMVVLLTTPGNDPGSYNEVIEDLIASVNDSAMKIKVADNVENLYPERVRNLKARNPEEVGKQVSKFSSEIVRRERQGC